MPSFQPKITRIVSGLIEQLKAQGAESVNLISPPIKLFTQYVGPDEELAALPACSIVVNREVPAPDGRDNWTADVTLRLYVQQGHDEYGQESMQRLAWQVLHAIHKCSGNFAGGRLRREGGITYGVVKRPDGRPIFRADIKFTAQYTVTYTEES